MPPRVYIFVPGILTFPGAADNWSGRAVTFAHGWPNVQAEKLEYFCGPVGRAFGQAERAERLAHLLGRYVGRGREIVLVGHSNGCDVILKALEAADWPRIEAIHLACGACEADFERNGLNVALVNAEIGDVFYYVAEKDQALRLAHTLIGRILGYGTLGLHGARNVAALVRGNVHCVRWPGLGHSGAFHAAEFGPTMVQFMRAEMKTLAIST